jgi:hypothetical protein
MATGSLAAGNPWIESAPAGNTPVKSPSAAIPVKKTFLIMDSIRLIREYEEVPLSQGIACCRVGRSGLTAGAGSPLGLPAVAMGKISRR